MKVRSRIAVTGFVATAVAFGPGRMGYGLFLPQLREEFNFGTGLAGAISSCAFGTFFLSLLLSGWLTPRCGPRLPVLIGGSFATLGFSLTALSADRLSMSVGVALCAGSAGFAWTPFSSMTKQSVGERYQERILSQVSTGTAFGIVAAGLLALGVAAMDQSWRTAWWGFAAIGLAAVAAPMLLLSGHDGLDHRERLDTHAVLQRVRSRETIPIYVLALSFGATNGTYLSYWVDHVVQSGGLAGLKSELTGPALFGAFGLAGVLGLLTGDVEEKVGLRTLLFFLFTSSGASLLLLAYLPDNWVGVIISASLQGMCLMALSATYSFWSERLFPDFATTGFTVVLLIYAFGNVVAPPLVGLTSERTGLGHAIALLSLLSFASLIVVWRVEDI